MAEQQADAQQTAAAAPGREATGAGTPVGTWHLGRLAESALERLGDRPSLYFEGEWHRSGALFDRAARLSTGLRELGVNTGDRVVVFMANSPDVGVLYNAVWRAGGAVTPTVFLLSPAELRHIVVDSGAAVVATSTELLPTALAATEGLSVPVIVAGADPEELEHPRTMALATVEDAPAGPVHGRGDDELAALLYTGGTTGRSKGVALTHRNLHEGTDNSRRRADVTGLVRGLTALPMSHSYGMLVTINAMHSEEPRSAALMRWFEPVQWLKLAEQHQTQLAAVVPSMISMLLDQPLEDYDLSNLTYVYSGGAAMSVALAERLERRLPNVTVLEGYGCTETSAIICSQPPNARRLGTVGTPVPGVEVRIVDDGGRDLPRGEDGEIIVRGPNVMKGYWHDEELTNQVKVNGWLHTGDIGHQDADGYITIVDRKKDLIVRGGFNVFPRDIEDALCRHPDVSSAGVVGRPDDRLGEEVVAFVTLQPGASLDEADLVAFARETIAKNKYPREIHIVDAMPLTPVGKMDRKQLRAMVTTVGAAGVDEEARAESA